jgi:F0F1-type ATP synthase delta subunit
VIFISRVKGKTHTTKITIYNFSLVQLLGNNTGKKEEKKIIYDKTAKTQNSEVVQRHG